MRGGLNRLAGLVGAGWLATASCSHAPQAPARRPVETVAEVARACAAPGAVPTCPALAAELEQLLARPLSTDAFIDLLTRVRADKDSGLPADVTRAVRAVAWEPPVAGRFDAVAGVDAQLVQYMKAPIEWTTSLEGQATFADLTLRRGLAREGIVPAARDRLNDLAAALRAGQEPESPAVHTGEPLSPNLVSPPTRHPPAPSADGGAPP